MNRYRLGKLGGGIFKYLMLALFAFIILFPFWMLIVASFLDGDRIITYPPTFWPSEGTLDNYFTVFTMQDGAYLKWMINSIIVSVINTTLVILFCTMAAYAFAKRKFPGAKIMFYIIVATQIIPGITTLIPQYLMMSELGWVNSYQALIFPGIANAFGVYMMTQFLKDVPDSLIEAATIDGSTAYGTFFKIVFPICVPQVSLLAIFNFTQQWGNFTWPLIVINQTSMMTLPVGIASMKDLNGALTGEIMAASVCSFVPLLIAFICASDKFIEGMTLGAVKE